MGDGSTKLAGLPLAKRKMTAQMPMRAANLMTVRTFCRLAPARAPDVVDGRQEEDEEDADDLLGQRRQGDEMGQVLGGEGHGQRGDGPRIDDQEERPAEEEREERAVGFAQVDVDAAGLGHGRAQLGEGDGAEEAEHPADDPDGQDEQRGLDAGGDAGGDEEDAGADDAADDDPDDVPKSQHALEVLTLCVHAR